MITIEQERRATERAELSCPARLKTAYSIMHGTLTNISVGGARFEGDALPREGATVLIEWEAHEMICEVVWVKGGKCGVRFERPIAELAVHEVVERNAKVEPAANLGNIPLGTRRSGFGRAGG